MPGGYDGSFVSALFICRLSVCHFDGLQLNGATLEPHYNAVSGVQCPIRVITDPAFYRNALTSQLGLASASGTICVLTVLPPTIRRWPAWVLK